MNRKFFSFIHGGKIHLAPNTKRIPADEFSTMVDSKEILKQVQADAKQYRQEVTAECEKIKEQAQREGFEEGYRQWIDHIATLEHEIKTVRADVEKTVFPVALAAAKKIVARELETSKTVITDIIMNSLKAVAQHKKIAIYVNREDIETVEKAKPKLAKMFEELEALSVGPRDDITPGGCIIETEGGIINAQIENQWLILENAFDQMRKEAQKKKKPPPKPEPEPELAEEEA